MAVDGASGPMRLACFKGTRPGIAGLFSIAVRWWLGGRYSHCELVFSDGYSGSSSWLDGGVRLKLINFDHSKWDFYEVKGDEQAAVHWFLMHQGEGFDLLGLLGFVWSRGTQRRKDWFCSEAVAASLGIPEPWRFDPCSIPIVVNQR